VITHEYTHAVQVQASLKYGKSVPAIYLQWLGYENEIRPDVLYGYPNAIVSYPISGVDVPAWFAEGTAQYQRQQLAYEHWDAHRDMILRSYILGDNLLTWNEMGQFSSITSLKAESIYNLGYALTRYIAEKYGEDKIRQLTQNLGDIGSFSMDKALRKAIGKDGSTLYNEWKTYLENDYELRLIDVKKDKIAGELIEKEGFANYYPQFSPDGSKIAYLSNQDYDYGATSLMIYDVKKKKSEAATGPVSTNYCWSPDGKKIIFAKRNSPASLYGTVIYDLYEYDIKSEEEKRLTEGLRAFSPTYSPDGKSIAFIVNKDGTLNLAVSDANGKNVKKITRYENGEQVYNPKFSPDGKQLLFDYSYDEYRKMARVDIATGEVEFLLDQDNIDYRNPVFSKDGRKVYYSSNKTGIFNIYSLDLESNNIKQITNVLGGAFMPSIDSSGNLAYATYEPTGYKIALLKNFEEKDPSIVGAYKSPDKRVVKYASQDTISGGSTHNWKALNTYNDRNIPQLPSTSYKSQSTGLSFIPVIRFDTYQRKDRFNFFEAIKPGLYFYSNEIMSRVSIFGGAAINVKGERDLFLQFQYDNGFPFFKDFFTKELKFLPKLTLDGYNVTRVSEADLVAGVDTIPVGLDYNLLTFDFGMAFHAINLHHNFRLGAAYSNYMYSLDAFALPSGISVRSSSETYFKALDFSLRYNYEEYYPTRNTDINPIGRKVDLQYNYEASQINPTLVVNDDGTVRTDFESRNLNKLYGSWLESFGLFNKKHSLSFRLMGATIFGPPVEDFYNFYVSGMPGMKGYPFYSLGGGRMASINVTYRLPVFSRIDTRLSPLYLDKLYLSVYGDYGNAWNGSDVSLDDFKKDIGFQLRLQATSFYVFPTSIFFDASYGFDKFTNVYQGTEVTYGQEWNFYFGILFGFDF
jgi:Tol biopolymer transport system component